MTSIEINKLDTFFTNDRMSYKETVLLLLNEVEKENNFKIKVLKASIQLHNKIPFAVIGFRRSKPYFFIEFYSSEKIDNSRIRKTIKKSEQQIINRVNVLSKEQVDKELLNWIRNSKVVAEKHKV